MTEVFEFSKQGIDLRVETGSGYEFAQECAEVVFERKLNGKQNNKR